MNGRIENYDVSGDAGVGAAITNHVAVIEDEYFAVDVNKIEYDTDCSRRLL